MSFLYEILPEYTKSTDVLIDNNMFMSVKSLEEYLSVIDEEIFDVMSDAVREILTYNNVFKIKNELLPYISFLLGYNWNYNLETDIQRHVLANILELYKRKGTKFHFNFNLQLLDPYVEIYEPIKDIFIIGKSRLNVKHLSSKHYYSPGIIVIKIGNIIPEIFEIFNQIKPSGWKILVEGKHGLFYNLHIKPELAIRQYYLSNVFTLPINPTEYDIQFMNAIQYINPQMLPIVMMGKTYLLESSWTIEDFEYASIIIPSSELEYHSLWRFPYNYYSSSILMLKKDPYDSTELIFKSPWDININDKIGVETSNDLIIDKNFITTIDDINNGFDLSDVWPGGTVTMSVFQNGIFQVLTDDYTIDNILGSEKINFAAGGVSVGDRVTVKFDIIDGELKYTATSAQTNFNVNSIWSGTGILTVYKNGVFQYNSVSYDYVVDSTPGSEKIIFNNGCNSGDRIVIQLKNIDNTDIIIATLGNEYYDISSIWNHNIKSNNIYRNGVLQLEETDYNIEKSSNNFVGSFDNIKDDNISTYLKLSSSGNINLGFSEVTKSSAEDISKIKLIISNLSGTINENIGVNVYQGNIFINNEIIQTSTEYPECTEHIIYTNITNCTNVRVILDIPSDNVLINEASIEFSVLPE